MTALFKRKTKPGKLERFTSKIPIIGKPIDRGYATLAGTGTAGATGVVGYVKTVIAAPTQYWIPITLTALLTIPLAAIGIGHYIDRRCQKRDEENQEMYDPTEPDNDSH